MSTHTPGPWEIRDINNSPTPHIVAVPADKRSKWDYDIICQLYEDTADCCDTFEDLDSFPNFKANMCLIAVAPELLKVIVKLHGVEGNVQINSGIAWLPDNTSLNLDALIDQVEGIGA